ncbi:hypothetical protein ACXGQW_09780 [Wenyingzhuangia sp. IMCC45533]
MTNELNEFKEGIVKDMSGLIAFSITEIETGVSYISHSNDSSFDVEIMASYNLEVLKAQVKAVKALEIQEKIEDILVTFENQIHIVDISEDASYFIYLAVDSSKNNLGMTRSILKKHKSALKDVI